MPASKLQLELKQNRPFASMATEALISISRTADYLKGELLDQFKPFDITHQQYNVLRILRGAGASGLPTLEIRTRMVEANPGITRLIDRLAAKELVSRQRCPGDRRQVLCFATTKALELLEQLDQPVEQANQQLMSTLDLSQQQKLISLLDQLRTTG